MINLHKKQTIRLVNETVTHYLAPFIRLYVVVYVELGRFKV